MYKVYHIDKNSVKSIYIFKGFENKEEYKEELIGSDIKKYLTKEDYKNDVTKIYTINDTIFKDDSIEIIKLKISKALDVKYSFEEVYMFGFTEITYTNKEIYDILTQNSTVDINYNRFFQFISNIYDIDISKLNLDKEIYSFDDIIALNIDSKPIFVKNPIGQRFYINKQYPLHVNPFDTIIADELLRKDGDDIVSTQNKSLLLDMKKIKNNVIYVCTPDDIYDFVIGHNESSIKESFETTTPFNLKTPIDFTTMLKLYYPFLYTNEVIDIDTYKTKKNEFQTKTKDMLDEGFESFNNNISLLHSIYNKRKSEHDYIDKGIKSLICTIENPEKINIPLEIIFKLLNTSKLTPFIKYNPGKGREKMYRLFTEKISKDGRKIPFLQKSYIMRLRNNLARTKSVTTHTIIQSKQIDKDSKNEILLNTTFFENGYIQIEYSNNQITTLEMVENAIMEHCIPQINIIGDFLNQKGYNFVTFNGFEETDNIIYDGISYQTSLNISKKIQINKYIGCLSSIINIINPDLKTGIEMTYKRVSYFNEMDAIEAYITRLVNKNMNRTQIIPLIKENFDISEKDAETKYLNWLSNIQVEQQLHENKKLRIKSNPGFEININRVPFKNTIIISVNSITNVKYIPLLEIYIDSMIRLTQDITTTDVPKQYINKVCKFKELVVKNVVDDIESKVAQNLQQQTGVSITGDMLEFGENIDDDEGLIGLLAEGDEQVDELGLDFGEESEVDEEGEPEDEISGKDTSSIIGSEIDDDSIEGLVFEGGQDSVEEGVDTAGTSISQASDLSDLLDFGDADTETESSLNTSPKSEKRTTKQSIPTQMKADDMSGKSDDKDKKKISIKESKKIESDDDTLMKDITGMPLKNPNPFFSKMNDRDPKLFIKRKTGKFNAYSRTCPMNVRRQPVILTDKEMEKIDRESPGSYSEKIKYGSSPDKQFWYICPRFWCLKTNTSMTEEDVKAGKCGGSDKIIPRDAKVVPKDAFVYEFTDAKEHTDQNGEYIQHYPGFVKQGTHPDNLCIPCCFKSWDAPVQQKRRNMCLKGKESKETTDTKIKTVDDYIKGAEKFPLDEDRWGYLPLSVQKLLHTDNSKCYSSTGRGIKPFKYCMLRKGVELNRNQSFIGALADIYVEYMKLKTATKTKEKPIKTPSIRQMKNIIVDAINIDDFISYFNGALIETFARESLSVNVSKYKTSNLYIELMKNIKNEKDRNEKTTYMKRIISSFENFIDYLKDPDVEIDHTYLWDIVHKPNKNLFPQGINLVILQIPDDDITNNIEILCPTNNYSSYLFNTKKPTLILMLKDGYYEPIYIYRDEETNIKIHKLFSLYNHQLLPNLKYLLEIIKRSYSKCQPLNSMPDKFTFRNNLHLEKVIEILKQKKTGYDVEIINQVRQYNEKIIGITVRVNDSTGYIPIEPSSMMKGIESIYIDDVEWKGITPTINVLKIVHKMSGSKIPCLPKIKVLEDGLIVGILTETNQFIMLDKPHEDIGADDLDPIDDYNYLDLDKKFMINTGEYDKDREKLIKFIELESNYFNSFRNTIRMLLNDYEHIRVRKQIETILDNRALLYGEKIDGINDILRKLLDEYVEFISISESNLLKLDSINTCLNNKSCDTQYCLTTDKTCKLIIPRKHLISKHDNEKIYFFRMADELIRYGFIKNYIFNPKSYLVLDKVDYKLQNDEIILLDTILEEGYFDNLIPMKINKYITNQVAEFIKPQRSIPYNNILDLRLETDDKTTKKITTSCIKNIRNKVSGVWNKFFNNKTVETIYKNTTECGYELFLTLLKDHNKKLSKITKEELKNVLIKEYNTLIETYGEDRILKKILLDQGKERIKSQVLSRSITLSQAIISEDYYLTNLDLIILSQYYDLPLIILSGIQMHELRGWNIGIRTERETKKTSEYQKYKKTRKMWIVNRDKSYEHYYFIRQLGIKRNIPQRYTLIHEKDSVRVSLVDINKKMTTIMKAVYMKRPSFEDYIKNYVRGITKLGRKKLVIETKATPAKIEIKKSILKKKKLLKKKIKLTDEFDD